MPGETFYEGAPPKYKGAIHTEPKITHTWTRGQGWTSRSEQEGTIDALEGLLPGLQQYCSQIVIERGGIYSRLDATWNGFTSGQQEDIDAVSVWGLHQQQFNSSLIDHPLIQDMEVVMAGTRLSIKAAVREFKRKFDNGTLSGINLGTWEPKAYTDWKNQNITTAEDRRIFLKWFRDIAADLDKFRVYQPVVSRTLLVSEVYSNYGIANETPPVYDSTDLFVAHTGVPPTINSALRAGQWLEGPPEVNPASKAGRYQIQQIWEYYLQIDEDRYPNRISS